MVVAIFIQVLIQCRSQGLTLVISWVASDIVELRSCSLLLCSYARIRTCTNFTPKTPTSLFQQTSYLEQNSFTAVFSQVILDQLFWNNSLWKGHRMCCFIKFVTPFYRSPDDEDPGVTKTRRKSVTNKSGSTKLLVCLIYFIYHFLSVT